MINLVFLGTPKIAESSLQHFINSSETNVLAVVTQPDKPAGRGHKMAVSPIKALAESTGIEVFQPTSIRKDEELITKLKNLKPDFFITVAFGQILSQEVLDIPKYGTINLHASLLPKYRGANPIQRAIVNGDKITGVTTMLTDIGVDTGDVLLMEEIEITENMNSLELAIKIAEIGPELLLKSMKGLISGEVQRTPQNHELATIAKKFTKEDGYIKFDKSALETHNLIRGMFGQTYTFYNGARVKLYESEVLKEEGNKNAGTIHKISKEGIEVSTENGLILIKELQAENKKRMKAFEWANGVNLKAGEKFE